MTRALMPLLIFSSSAGAMQSAHRGFRSSTAELEQLLVLREAHTQPVELATAGSVVALVCHLHMMHNGVCSPPGVSCLLAMLTVPMASRVCTQASCAPAALTSTTRGLLPQSRVRGNPELHLVSGPFITRCCAMVCRRVGPWRDCAAALGARPVRHCVPVHAPEACRQDVLAQGRRTHAVNAVFL